MEVKGLYMDYGKVRRAQGLASRMPWPHASRQLALSTNL